MVSVVRLASATSCSRVHLSRGDRGFESTFLQRRVCELSVPLLNRPEGDVRGIGFQTVRTYIAIGNSEARGAMLARTRVRISSSHRIEPDAQILREPQMLKLDRYPRKAGRLHRRQDRFRRPEILKVDSVSLREIFIIEPVRALLWTEIAHDETPAVAKSLKHGSLAW